MPIELDTEGMRAQVIRDAGGNPIGEKGGLVWFTDPVTKSTLLLKPEDVTEENVRKKLEESRRKFGFTVADHEKA